MPPTNLTFTVPTHWISGLILLGIANFFFYLAREGRNDWRVANSKTLRSFENTDSAMEISRRGCAGITSAFGYTILGVVTLLFALDQALLGGELMWAWVLEYVRRLQVG